MSSYISPAPQGDPKATGAYAVAIAAQAGGTNNDGHATDSAGNVVIDRVWGNFPLQPNDVRNAAVTNTGGAAGSDVTVVTDGPMRDIPGAAGNDYGWAQTTKVASQNLAYGNITKSLNNGITFNVKPDSHELAESGYASFPSFASTHQNVYRITQAVGDGSTRTYTAPNNFLKAGDTVNITGTGLDGTNLTVASANRYTFTVSASGTGSYINISGTARYTDEVTANDGAYVSGVDYVKVPSVLGFLTASAQDALNDAELVVTTASAAANSAKSITRINVTATSAATVYASGADSAYPVGTKVSIGAGTGIPTALVGTWTVTGGASGNIVISGSGFTVADTGSISPSASLTGATGTIKTQSVAAGAASISAGVAITITPWA
jgi:hypothetical protein